MTDWLAKFLPLSDLPGDLELKSLSDQQWQEIARVFIIDDEPIEITPEMWEYIRTHFRDPGLEDTDAN